MAVKSADWVTEHRDLAVLQVLDGVSKSQVARECGASRQSVHSWVTRYEALGLPGLADRSRRPLTSPTEVSPTVVAMVCELRRVYPRWGAQRITHELTLRGVDAPPSRSSAYRILIRHGLVAAQQQNHKRKYRRWQRDAPMQLWQIDIMGGVFLADGRECKLVAGIDDHSRFVVVAAVVAEPGARAIRAAFTAAMATYGVPSEVLTDNGKQFTGRFTKPYPAEVLFERICRENGITTRLTKPRSPTTTGKIERFHKTLRRELLDSAGPFVSIEAAQETIGAWVHGDNYSRPHQSLGWPRRRRYFAQRPSTWSRRCRWPPNRWVPTSSTSSFRLVPSNTSRRRQSTRLAAPLTLSSGRPYRLREHGSCSQVINSSSSPLPWPDALSRCGPATAASTSCSTAR